MVFVFVTVRDTLVLDTLFSAIKCVVLNDPVLVKASGSANLKWFVVPFNRIRKDCHSTACVLFKGGKVTSACQNTASNSCVSCLPVNGEAVCPIALNKLKLLLTKLGVEGIVIILATTHQSFSI